MLTKEQEKCADRFLDFMLSDKKEFWLFGAAGTGKTYLVKHLLNNTLDSYHETSKLFGFPTYLYALTATTNAAARVLSKQLGEGATTVYSKFKVTVYENYKTGETSLRETSNEVIKDFLIVVDEVSMLSQEMLEIMRKRTKNCKFLFIGDPHQLKPVKENIAKPTPGESESFLLTEPVRNKDSKELTDLCEHLVLAVNTTTRVTFNSGVDVKILDTDEMKKELDNHFINNNDNSVIVAYTNEKCMQYNKYIRINRKENFFQVGKEYICNSMYEHLRGIKQIVPTDLHVVLQNILNKNKIVYKTQNGTLLPIKTLNANITNYSLNPNTIQNIFLRSVSIAEDPLELADALKVIAKEKDWGLYYNIKKHIMDLRECYSMTIHKAQGATYDNVFIDLDSFSSCWDIDTAVRLLYVAVSRARKKVYLYGDLPRRFGYVS